MINEYALRLLCIVTIAILQRNSSAVDVPVRTGRFLQEVALHRDRQVGLSEQSILAVFEDSDGILVQTASGLQRWNGERWAIENRPKAVAEQSLPEGDSNQIATSTVSVRRAAASTAGLFEAIEQGRWEKLTVSDGLGRLWATADVRAAAYDVEDRLWFATLAGVGRRDANGTWRFFEGRDGLPFNDFTCAAASPDGSVWFGTTRGAVCYDHGVWRFRQGLRWLPHDEVRAIHVDDEGTAWFATAGGVGCIARKPMTLQQKADYYEEEIDQKLKRTEFGYVNSGRFRSAGDKRQVTLTDSDNDGLWTAMYGASQCYAFAVTNRETSRQRARRAFAALRFLQQVTQGGEHSPPPGFVARTVLPISAPNPNQGRLEFDRNRKRNDDLMWKIYEPRWPRSKDGNWYWKSDTSSDELDGHYFFYALYFDLVARSERERAEVQAVVRELTDHLIEHEFTLVDHDGNPTRWANFRPASLNSDYRWHHERGLNSLSMLSYLAVARHVTGDRRYEDVAKRLRDEHHYDTNLHVPKMQRGIGSGNQSDDEMAFMSFYNLIKYTRDEVLRTQYLAAFYGYWMLEQPERNPFFHFAYAAVGQGAKLQGTFGPVNLSPWGDWLEDSVSTLKWFPLDRINWRHTNSHRLDVVPLPTQQAIDYLGRNQIGQPPSRGYRVDGKVLPVDERFFEHWNTDLWRLDTGGDGRTLGCGSVFLLPYYMGRYHKFLAD